MTLLLTRSGLKVVSRKSLRVLIRRCRCCCKDLSEAWALKTKVWSDLDFTSLPDLSLASLYRPSRMCTVAALVLSSTLLPHFLSPHLTTYDLRIDKSVTLSSFVGRFDVFHSSQGNTGQWDSASKSQIENDLQRKNKDEAIELILTEGENRTAKSIGRPKEQGSMK